MILLQQKLAPVVSF